MPGDDGLEALAFELDALLGDVLLEDGEFDFALPIVMRC